MGAVLSNAFIAARHQLTILMVEVILREQIRLKRDRAGRADSGLLFNVLR
jgi:hypothetical protein